MRPPVPSLAALTCVVSLLAAAPAAAEDRLIVRFHADASAGDRAEARRDAGATAVRALLRPGAQVLATEDAPAALRALRRDPDVADVEIDHRLRLAAAVPNDPGWPALWGLQNTGQTVNGRIGTAGQDIGVLAAWDRSRGAGVTVAVLDTGVTRTADLDANAWVNPGEIAGNGTDDDANGKVDDVHGWNFAAGTPAVDDDHGHGTHVAGTIAAAAGNGTGIAGVAPQAEVMAVKVLAADGSGYTSDIADGFEYAAAHGAAIVNASLGGPGASDHLKDAIARHPGTLLVAAAGNEATDVDTTPSYPCAYDLANVVCVAATTNTGAFAGSFSNYGKTTVDLAAPGRDVLSLSTAGGSVLSSGTSMAAPHVAGAAALGEALRPAATPTDLRTALVQSVRPDASLSERTVAGGGLNAAALLDRVSPPADAAPAPPPAATTPTTPAAPTSAPAEMPAVEPAPPTVPPATSAPSPGPTSTVRPTTPPPVRVSKIRRRPPRHVAVRGTANGRVTVRVCRGRSCATKTVTPRRGTWSARVRLRTSTRRGAITVRARLSSTNARAATARLG